MGHVLQGISSARVNPTWFKVMTLSILCSVYISSMVWRSRYSTDPSLKAMQTILPNWKVWMPTISLLRTMESSFRNRVVTWTKSAKSEKTETRKPSPYVWSRSRAVPPASKLFER